MKITKKTMIADAIEENEKTAEILFESGMSCAGCPCAQQETIEQGCKAHGFSDEKIKKLVERLNEK